MAFYNSRTFDLTATRQTIFWRQTLRISRFSHQRRRSGNQHNYLVIGYKHIIHIDYFTTDLLYYTFMPTTLYHNYTINVNSLYIMWISHYIMLKQSMADNRRRGAFEEYSFSKALWKICNTYGWLICVLSYLDVQISAFNPRKTSYEFFDSRYRNVVALHTNTLLKH